MLWERRINSSGLSYLIFFLCNQNKYVSLTFLDLHSFILHKNKQNVLWSTWKNFSYFLFKMRKKDCCWPKTLFESSTYRASFSFIFSNKTQQKQWHDLNLGGKCCRQLQIPLVTTEHAFKKSNLINSKNKSKPLSSERVKGHFAYILISY